MTNELQQRVADCQRKLSLLSEGRTVKWDRTSSGKPESRTPAGVHDDDRPPDPDKDPLIVWYRHKLERAKGDERLILAATVEAELRHARQTHRSPASMTAGAANTGRVEDTGERDRRIEQDYPGLSPLEVAIIESHRAGWCSEKHVRDIRRHGVYDPVTNSRLGGNRDPDTGHPLAPEVLLKGQARAERMAELRAEGRSLREIALMMRTSHQTVMRTLDRHGLTRAA